MKLTTKGRYAVTAIVDLADRCSEGPIRISEIAARQHISQAYLEQLFSKLRRAGLVGANRGPGGGYQLARPSTQIAIAEILRAVDDTFECDELVPQDCCGDHSRERSCELWKALNRHLRHFLEAVTVADVTEGRLHDTFTPNPRKLISDAAD